VASLKRISVKQVIISFCLPLQKIVVYTHQTEMFSCFSPKSVEGKMEKKAEEEMI